MGVVKKRSIIGVTGKTKTLCVVYKSAKGKILLKIEKINLGNPRSIDQDRKYGGYGGINSLQV